MARMAKLGGTDGAAYATVNPPHIATTASPAERQRARNGRALSRWAAPAGAAMSPSRSSAPTAWVAAAAVTPTSPRNTKPRARTGTPRAAATDASRLENSSGRAMAIRPATTPRATTASVQDCECDSPKMEPNSTFTPDLASVPLDDVVYRV